MAPKISKSTYNWWLHKKTLFGIRIIPIFLIGAALTLGQALLQTGPVKSVKAGEIQGPNMSLVLQPSPTKAITNTTPEPPQRPSAEVVFFPALPIRVEYSAELDRMVYTSAEPNLLHIWNPTSGEEQTVSLPEKPLSLSVQGTKAAVGHMKGISYIDLATARALQMYETRREISAVLLSAKGWIYSKYLFTDTKISESVDLSQINLGNFEQVAINGDALYVVEQGEYRVIPLETDGTPRLAEMVIYKKSSCGQIWFWPDQTRYVNACGLVFATDATKTYLGELERTTLFSNLLSIVFLPESNRIIAQFPGNTDRGSEWGIETLVYEYNSLNLLARLPMPKITNFGADSRVAFSTPRIYLHPNRKSLYMYVGIGSNYQERAGVLNRPLPIVPDPAAAGQTVELNSPVGQKDLSLLPYMVEDARYSKTLDRLVIVTNDPPRLLVVDPTTGESKGIILPKKARKVALSPDELTAAVSHDTLISIIDLKTLNLYKTFIVNHSLTEIAFAGDGKVYFAPNGLYSIEVETGKVEEVNNRISGEIARNALGDIIYVCRGSDLFTVNLRTLDTPTETSVGRCNSSWISNDGKLLIAGSPLTSRDGSGFPIFSVTFSESKTVAVAVARPSSGMSLLLIDGLTMSVFEIIDFQTDTFNSFSLVNGFVFLNAAETHYIVVLRQNIKDVWTTVAGRFPLELY